MGFSLKWFRSKKEEELESLKVEEQKIKNELLSKDLEAKKAQKPYLNIKLVGNILTIVLRDGNILSKTGATSKEYDLARYATSEAELFTIANCSAGVEEKQKYEKEVLKAQNIIKGVERLKEAVDFTVKDNSVYLKGINRSLPSLLVEKFAEIIGRGHAGQSEEYQALKKFWLKCCLNPNAQSAEDLYEFLNHHNFKIDKHGNFYAYRRVRTVGNEKNKKLVKFVANTYNKVKAVWKKKPSDFFVWQSSEGDYFFNKDKYTKGLNKLIGNLHDLYVDLPNLEENRYTDAHTRKMDYRVGETASIPRDKGDDDNSISCSRGLHIASKAYDYSSFGDVPVLAIINPIDILAVPKGESGKLRTCRWFFAMTLDKEEQHILDEDDFDVSELGDIFEETCLKDLENYIQNSFAEEVKRHTFTLPSITGKEITNIVLSLEEMKDSISKRVVNG